MMDGCNTGLETNNILMDAHFPGSTPLDCTLQSASSQVEMKVSSESAQSNRLGNEIADALKHQYNLVLDKNLKNLDFLDPNRIKEAFNDMRSLNAGGPD